MNREEMQNKINELKADIEVLENELKNIGSKGWKPTVGEMYNCVGLDEEDSYIYYNDNPSMNMIKIGNYFKTQKQAKRAQFEQNLRLKLRKFAEDNNDKIDWKNTHQNKYYINYNYSNKEFIFNISCIIKHFGQIYFSSEELAEEATELFHDDLIKYFEEE